MSEMLSEERSASLLEENLKKAVTEYLILSLLSEQERFIGEISYEIDGRSKGAVHIEFPYASIYRISRAGYIVESSKRSAPDGRRRQYYRIMEQGREYLSQLDRVYHRFIGGVSDVLQKEGNTDG